MSRNIKNVATEKEESSSIDTGSVDGLLRRLFNRALSNCNKKNKSALLKFLLFIPVVLNEIATTGGRILEILIAIAPFLSESKRARLTKVVSIGGIIHLTTSIIISILNTVSQYIYREDEPVLDESNLFSVTSKYGWNYDSLYVETDEFISMNLFFKYLLKHFNIIEVVGKTANKPIDIDFFHACLAAGSEYLPSMILVLKGADNTTHEGVRFAVNISYRGDHLDIVGEHKNRKELEDFIHQIIAEYISSFKGVMFNLKAKHSGSTNFSISTMCCERPAFYDKKVFNKLDTLCKRAISTGKKLSVLLYGPPGVGKTSILNELLSNMDALIFNIEYTPPDGIVSFLQRIQTPKILVMEELDADDPEGYADKTERIARILKLLDSKAFSIAIMTVNSTELHPALVRSGRADLKNLFELPDLNVRQEIIQEVHAAYTDSVIDDETLNLLAEKTEGFSHADITAMYNLSYLHDEAVTDYINTFIADKERFESFDDNKF